MAQSVHYGHQASFVKYSNQGWDPLLHFSNGGLNVNLLKWNRKKINKERASIEAYHSMDRIGALQQE